MFIDTHTHLYLEEFQDDSMTVIDRAVAAGVTRMLLPNIDGSSWEPMLALALQYPGKLYAMAGLHPTSVLPETVEKEILNVEQQLETGRFIAIGEIGIDLYWDKTHQSLQEEVFRQQLRLAIKYRLPVAIHVRNSYNEVWRILKQEMTPGLRGVFHCFPGNEIQARQVTELGFMLGIGGVVTYKNSAMQKVVAEVGLEHLLLETDAPFLTPVPFRGKRNEPAYIPLIAEKIAELCNTKVIEVAEKTTRNALNLFNLNT
ncbi:MAG TPA: TatD family hydrolase [Bacteroidales bacterium]|mgnify:CR=1 FL=1|jgi:TatD DNase family protein|nr:TatD family hydrolase [Bacteroidales bacterium]